MPTARNDQDIQGVVLDVTGNRAICRLDLATLTRSRQQAEHGRAAVASIGAHIKITVMDRLVVGSLSELKADRDNDKAIIAEIEFMGEGPCGPDGNLSAFHRGVTLYPLPGDSLRLTSRDDLEHIFSPHDVPHIHIGTIYPTEDLIAPILFDRLMSRHFAIVGSNGTGKSTLVALMLNRIIAAAPQSHVIILDPHCEYASAFGANAQVWDGSNLQIPYWLMNFEEHCEAFITSIGESRMIDVNIMAKCLIKARSKNQHVGNLTKITADSPISYSVEDLIDALQEEGSRLEKQADPHHYTQLRLNIEQFFADPRFQFLFKRSYWNNSMTQLLGDLLRIPVAGKPISIIDLSGLPSEIADLAVSILARLIFEFAVWSPHEQRLPVLLICEEAQRYLPNHETVTVNSAQRQLERIAREGRKYGVSLGLITQRPSEISETALSQCGTIIALRLNNLRDQAQVKAILSESARSYLDIISALQNQECIISGEGVPVPMRVRIDTLPAELAPASYDPAFSERWNRGDEDSDILADTVRNWREGS